MLQKVLFLVPKLCLETCSLEALLRSKRLGRTSCGVVYEPIMKPSSSDDAMLVRRITTILDQPTRDGDAEIHLLTNLPAKVAGTTIQDVRRAANENLPASSDYHFFRRAK